MPLPSPAEWVCVRRIRVTPSIEQIYWLTKKPAIATANNRHILRPYSQSMRTSVELVLSLLAQGETPETILADYSDLVPDDLRPVLLMLMP